MKTLVLAVGVLLAAAAGAAVPKAPPASRDCTACHTESGWSNVHFNHDATRLPLRDRHAEQPCRACHRDLHKLALDPSCSSCHVDVHGNRRGNRCERCHDTRSFQTGAGVEAHSQTRFPLVGRHALVPCEQCHQARADRSFAGVPADCTTCHRDALERTVGTQYDHTGLGPDPSCRRCHTPVSWRRAILTDHDKCFPIYARPHDNIKCLSCHTSLTGVAVSQCMSFTASCTRCHSCSSTDGEHRGRVSGYQCADRKCYECHPHGTAE